VSNELLRAAASAGHQAWKTALGAVLLLLGALREIWSSIKKIVSDEVRATLEPLQDENARTPIGMGSKAFWIGLSVVLMSLVSALATYLILTNLTPIIPRDDVVVIVLALNLILIIAMVGVIAFQAVGLVRSWRRKVPGARLHARIVALFSLITALPALVLAVAATTTFSRALDNRFNEQTTTIVQNSLNVAYAYLEEHGQIIRTDIVNMGKDLDDAVKAIGGDQTRLRQELFTQAALRDLPVAYIVNGQGVVKLAALEDERIPYVAPPEHILRSAENGHVPLLMPVNTFRVAAVAKLNQFPDSYLYVARGVDPKVVTHLRRTEQGVREYERLREVRGGIKFAHAVMYTMISLTAVLASIWVGLWFAGRFVAPIRRLIGAAQQVATGDLKVALPIRRGEGDLRRLSENFNHMTQQLDEQRSELVNANAQLIERRRFMEAVLSGVSAGVMGLDPHGRITIANTSAARLLGREDGALIGQTLAQVVPEFQRMLDEAAQGGKPVSHLSLVIGGEERTFSVRITQETQGEAHSGSVVTFDDISELVSAQRTSAWADVARRIAHEIKNPLTPIQLSAERLRRKYGRVIQDDREVFDRCTDTIIRQVGDVTRMVDEFSAFARMPKPQMEDHDIRDVVRAAVLDRHVTTAEITFETKVGPTPIMLLCDRRLIAQAVTNLVKNAQEAVQTYAESGTAEPGWKGRIETIVTEHPDNVTIEVIDNGPGLPKHNRNRLLEPYVTTKGNKGTGLGLAIVMKSVEQHAGTLALEDAPPAPDRAHGALVRITLPFRGNAPVRALPQPAAASG